VVTSTPRQPYISLGNGCIPPASKITFEGAGRGWGTVTHAWIVGPGIDLLFEVPTEGPWVLIYEWVKPPFLWLQYLLLFVALLALVVWGTF
jgi:hypothetical protein